MAKTARQVKMLQTHTQVTGTNDRRGNLKFIKKNLFHIITWVGTTRIKFQCSQAELLGNQNVTKQRIACKTCKNNQTYKNQSK